MFCSKCGAKLEPNSQFCSECGVSIQQEGNVVQTQTTSVAEGSTFGWGVLGFFFPIVGLILFLMWKQEKPKSSKSAGIGALVGVGVNILIFIITFVIAFSLGMSETTSTIYY